MSDGYVFGTRVRAIKTRNEVNEGDEGVVTAAWKKATPLVLWDKDQIQRPLRKRNMEIIGGPMDPDVLHKMLNQIIADRQLGEYRLGQEVTNG